MMIVHTIYIYISTHIYIYIHVYIYTFIYIYVYLYIYIYICVCTQCIHITFTRCETSCGWPGPFGWTNVRQATSAQLPARPDAKVGALDVQPSWPGKRSQRMCRWVEIRRFHGGSSGIQSGINQQFQRTSDFIGVSSWTIWTEFSWDDSSNGSCWRARSTITGLTEGF